MSDSTTTSGNAAGTMRAWRTHEYGPPLEALKLDIVPIPEPGPGEVRVKVQAIPLNLNDIERISGGNKMVNPDLPYSPGMEVMGVVDTCGPGAEAWLGKRVVAMPRMAHGGYAEYAVCPQAATFEMPDDIPLPDAAALYYPFHLAWLGLHDRADIKAGETVLIHAAAGGSGSAAIQLAVNAGARVIASVGSDDKKQLCSDLGAELVLNYNSQDLVKEVLAFTQNRGVDIVFDNVGEAVMDKSMHCIAYNGRYLMMGFASNKACVDEKFIVPRRLAVGNFKLCGVILSYVPEMMAAGMKEGMGWNFATTAVGAKIQNEILTLLRAKKIKAIVGKTVSFNELPAAIDSMGKRQTVGRVIALL